MKFYLGSAILALALLAACSDDNSSSPAPESSSAQESSISDVASYLGSCVLPDLVKYRKLLKYNQDFRQRKAKYVQGFEYSFLNCTKNQIKILSRLIVWDCDNPLQ